MKPNNGIVRITRFDMECVERAIAYLHKNYFESISAEHLSIEVSLNVKKLQAGFKQRTGLTIHPYLLKIRLEHAKRELETSNLSVTNIAAKNGFKGLSQFGKIFRKYTGQTPMEYRYGA
jgi:two-component system response regulator YesN